MNRNGMGWWVSLLRTLARHRDFSLGLGLCVTMAVLVGLSPWIVPHDPEMGNLFLRLRPPVWAPGGSWEYPLGTDALGRDMLSRILVGGRISLLVALGAVVLQGALGLLVGLVAGYYGRWVDMVLMRLVDIQLSIPFLILALAVAAALGPGVDKVIIVLGITGWATYARVARAATLQAVALTYVEAARAIGQSTGRIMLRHILPNISSSLLVTATFQVARMIIAEASLSFLGLGVPPDIPTWGSMIAEGREYLRTAWWIATLPGFAIMLTVLGANLLGNGMRDILDPKVR